MSEPVVIGLYLLVGALVGFGFGILSTIAYFKRKMEKQFEMWDLSEVDNS